MRQRLNYLLWTHREEINALRAVGTRDDAPQETPLEVNAAAAAKMDSWL